MTCRTGRNGKALLRYMSLFVQALVVLLSVCNLKQRKENMSNRLLHAGLFCCNVIV